VPDTNPLRDIIANQIRSSGPISLAAYMRFCLTHPKYGYYTTADPLGADGDFITAPEVSQMFGELIGLWVANCWQMMGRPSRFDLVELGPGRGTLLEDACRVFTRVDGLLPAMRLKLIESNEKLKSAQRQRLLQYNPDWGTEITDLDKSDAPLIVIANEFFDALPIRQYQKHQGKWHERAIGLRDDAFGWGLAPTPLPETAVPSAIKDAAEGEVWEAGLLALDTMGELAGRIAKRGGAMLAIDYGYARTQTGETFQAVENHAYADPLANPGKADLTAHVDFEALAQAATLAGADALPLTTQSAFLKAQGIDERAEALAAANPSLADSIRTAHERLTGDKQMGTLFKVLCVAQKGLAPYPFDTSSPANAA